MSRGAATDTHDLARVAADACAAKKGEDIVLFDVSELLTLTGAFVVAAGANARQVRTMVEEAESRLREVGIRPLATEGLDEATWVLVDLGDIVLHVFQRETREYYGLERLWADAPRIPWEEPRPDEAATG